MLREGLENMIKNISSSKSISSFEAIKAKQEAFGATFSNGFGNWPIQSTSGDIAEQNEVNEKTEDLEAIKQQLSDL
jgi:hypothetical protein